MFFESPKRLFAKIFSEVYGERSINTVPLYPFHFFATTIYQAMTMH